MQFLSKLQESQSVLGAKKTISKKKHRRKKSPLDSLSGLADVLPTLEERIPPKQHESHSRNQGRARQQLVVSEAKQLSKVLQHPQFKSAPFTAVREHLVNMLGPGLEEKMTPETEKRTRKRRSHKKKKKKKKKKKMKKMNDMEE